MIDDLPINTPKTSRVVTRNAIDDCDPKIGLAKSHASIVSTSNVYVQFLPPTIIPTPRTLTTVSLIVHH